MKPCLTVITAVASLLVLLPVSHGQQRQRDEHRVARPDWSDTGEFADVFFEDAFADALVGDRPPHLLPKPDADGVTSKSTSGSAGGDPSALVGWSSLVSVESLGNEVKAIGSRLAQLTTNKRRFLENKPDARIDLGILAIVLAILDDYDQTSRGKSRLAEVRGQIEAARAAFQDNSQFYQSTRLASALVTDLIRGNLPPSDTARAVDWSEIADRGIIMARLETALHDRLAKAIASSAGKQPDLATLLHEAQVVAALGQVLSQNGLADAADETYVDYCRRLTSTATNFARQLDAVDPDQLTRSAQQLEQRCTDCHDEYR